MAKLNPYLLDALHAWGAYRRDEDITGTGYSSETMEYRMMSGVAWSTGGEPPEPHYRQSEDARRVRLIVDTMPAKLQLVLWASYVGFDGPMSEDDGRQAMGVPIGEYRDLVRLALSKVADGLGMPLHVRW